jgi:hypothetical protein
LTDKDADSGQKPFHYEGGVPVFDISRLDKVESEQANARIRDDEHKRDQLSINKWVMRFTGALVFCSIIAGGVSFYQARVAKWNAKAAEDNAKAASDMVQQMKTSGNDTHELAVQAKNQADRAKDIADRTLAQATATNRLAKSAEDTLSTTRSNFVKDQRPYMWAMAEPPIFEEGKRIMWPINYINYGRSPAIHAKMCTRFYYGPRDQTPRLTMANLVEGCRTTESFSDLSTTTGVIVPPGDKAFMTEATPQPFSGIALQQIRDTDFALGVVGKITYEDILGNSYLSTFCLVRFAAGGLKACPNMNEIK